jgi:uncharacterized membrane protein YqgA involved in biofilm formation
VFGTFVNALAVVLGALTGITFKKKVPERIVNSLPEVIGLFTLYLGISMALKSQRTLALLFSLILGEATGTFLRLQNRLEMLGGRFTSGDSKFIDGLMTAFLTFCVGPMTIIGSIRDGMGDPSIILAKSIMDGVVSIALAASLGVGVLFSAVPLLLMQGSLALLGSIAGQALPEIVVNEITATGGVLMIGIGVNLIGLKRIRVGDGLPALLYASVLPLIIPF